MLISQSYHNYILVKINAINKIINIHPALLPKYGGKGMYGNFVHEAVVTNNEKEFISARRNEVEEIIKRNLYVLGGMRKKK